MSAARFAQENLPQPVAVSLEILHLLDDRRAGKLLDAAEHDAMQVAPYMDIDNLN
jgi:hypothetical protein